MAADDLAARLFGFFGDIGEQAHATVEGAEERLLLVDQDALNFGLALADFGEGAAHGLDHGGDQLVEEWLAGAKILAPVAFGPAKDAAHNIAPLLIAGGGTIGQRKRQRADVIGHHAVGGIAHVIEATGVGWRVSKILNSGEQGAEQVDIVVAFLALKHRADTLEAHACVDMLGGQRAQGAIGIAVELDEHIVPDLDAAVRTLVDERFSRLVWREIDVDFCAGTAGAGVAHFPKIVFLVPQVDVFFWDVGGLGPNFSGLGIGSQIVVGVALKNGGVQAGGIEAPDLGEELPGPADGFFLEVVAEGPVAQHFKESVVVGVFADIVEIVVFAAGTDTFLGIDRPAVGASACAQKYILELVHAGVGEQQCGVIERDDRAAGHECVAMLGGEEIDEFLANLVSASNRHIKASFIDYSGMDKFKLVEVRQTWQPRSRCASPRPAAGGA